MIHYQFTGIKGRVGPKRPIVLTESIPPLITLLLAWVPKKVCHCLVADLRQPKR